MNLFFGKKVFSIVKNLKYLIIGLPLISITAAVIMNGNVFSWGGAVGDMGKEWMFKTLGQIGTIGILGVAFLAYIIWRFNPDFRIPSKATKNEEAKLFIDQNLAKEEWPDEVDTIQADLKGANTMKGNAGILNIPAQENPALNHELNIIEKEIPEEIKKPGKEKKVEEIPVELKEEPIPEVIVPQKNKPVANIPSGLELEIKTAEEKPAGEEKMTVEKVQQLKPYDPVLDLRDYKYPSLDLLENHGSEKIVQDATELENNKNQIINTLKNYDINIQRISATVGPTVTLYEIIPAAGVRISRIKNLEDDICIKPCCIGYPYHCTHSR